MDQLPASGVGPGSRKPGRYPARLADWSERLMDIQAEMLQAADAAQQPRERDYLRTLAHGLRTVQETLKERP